MCFKRLGIPLIFFQNMPTDSYSSSEAVFAPLQEFYFDMCQAADNIPAYIKLYNTVWLCCGLHVFARHGCLIDACYLDFMW